MYVKKIYSMKHNVSNRNIVEQITAGHYFVERGFIFFLVLNSHFISHIKYSEKILKCSYFWVLWLKGQRNKGMLLCRAL